MKKKKRIFVVVDTNVVVSGMITKNMNSPTVSVLESLTEKSITPLYCDEILKEYGDVLCREKFHLPMEKVKKFIEMVKSDGVASHRMPSKEILPDFVIFLKWTLWSLQLKWLKLSNKTHNQ